MLKTRIITNDADLAALEQPWNALSGGEPLLSWDWLATWWKHYGALDNRELHTIAIYDDAELIGIAPFYRETSRTKGNVLTLLGTGHVCTDHLSLICRPEDAERVAVATAEYLTTNDSWDRLELPAIDDGDVAISRLAGELQSKDCVTSRHRASNCWIIDLPKTWDEFLNQISSSHRRQLRLCTRKLLETGRSKLHVVTTPEELNAAWEVLVDLHQQRRKALGDNGCFASPEFHYFHREVTQRLLAKGQLRMSWIELDGKPFTAEYHLAGPGIVHTYQSGMDTDRLSDSPGRVAYQMTVKRSIEEGYQKLDFMRGDEAYKAHFRAVVHPQFDYRIFPNRRLARLRGTLEGAGRSFKQWVKQGVASVVG